MSAPQIGLQILRKKEGIVSTLGADFSKGLLIETSDDASPTEYPLDTPIRISTSETDAVEALGTGALRADVQGINDQLSRLNSGADVTIMRVSEGVDVAATSAAIVDVLNSITDIASDTNATPRLVHAGRTAWRIDMDTTNPVVAALEANLGKILAISPVQVDDTSSANAIDAREPMSSGRLMPIGVAARVWEDGSVVTRSMAARVMGLFMRIDNDHGGYPFDPICNQPIYGLAGLSRKIRFGLFDGSTEGQQMLEGDVSIVAEGETGVDGAIADGGYHFLGTDNTETGDLWSQIHQVRGVDYIVTQIVKITREFLGPKLSPDSSEAWVNSIAFMLRDHKAAGHILGHTPKDELFQKDKNSPASIRLGILKLSLGVEVASSFKRGDFEISPYFPALDELVDTIIARLSAV